MRPSRINRYVASIVRAQAKMHEYQVPSEHQIRVPQEIVPERLFFPAVATLGDIAASVFRRSPGESVVPNPSDRDDLLFYARVLWMHAESLRVPDLNPTLNLLSSGAYYLAGMPGISKVLLDRFHSMAGGQSGELEGSLAWVLSKPWQSSFPMDQFSSFVCDSVFRALSGQAPVQAAREHLKRFREQVYQKFSSEEVLLADVFCAVANERFANSARGLLPALSQLPLDTWQTYFGRSRALPELWPSQRLLGNAGVYAGTSSVIQMPTSAGKTKAIELVIRSSFLSGRASLAVVVAPFRALCAEIATSLREEFRDDGYLVNQVSDVIQADFIEELFEFLDFAGAVEEKTPSILVVTPEKLLYILRQQPELAGEIGLIVFDEGHQFDTGARGVTYELLVTSIKDLVQERTQVVLISAVIQNPEALSGWLLDSTTSIVSDNNLQTQRTIAYASWREELGRITYQDSDADGENFFVPRVLESRPLALRGRERRVRVFPDRGDSTSIALFLAVKLVRNGAVALFCGIKASVSKVLHDALDVFGREPGVRPPSEYCRPEELRKLIALYARNFGADSYLTAAAGLGVFGHHSDTPHGLRLAIEHGMRAGDIQFVACTSTLAQGVNLPIRYLLVTSTRQGDGTIRIRDFQNLMGRAGRAGIHGEGTVIFTNPKVLDGRNNRFERWRWAEVQSLLHPENTEPTESTLLKVLAPILNADKTRSLGTSPIEYLLELVRDRAGALSRAANLAPDLLAMGFDSEAVLYELELRAETISALESYLMSSSNPQADLRIVSAELATKTLAYSLATEPQKSELASLFDAIARHIQERVPSPEVRKRYGRTLLGVEMSVGIDAWANENVGELMLADSPLSMFQTVWPLLVSSAASSRLRASQPNGAVLNVGERWIEGDTFEELLNLSSFLGMRYPYGAQFRDYKIDDVVGLCEQTFGFEIQLIVAALMESIQAAEFAGADDAVTHLESLQKMLKYGLKSSNAIAFFEAGFSERVVATHLASRIRGQVSGPDAMKSLLREHQSYFRQELEQFPAYFTYVLDSMLVQ